MHPLDNPSWHALTTLQSHFAITAEHAQRFYQEVCVHGAFPDELAESPTAQAGWTNTRSVDLVEMVQEAGSSTTSEADSQHDARIIELAASDLPQMSNLYEATRPGRKLYPRLMELGGFIGIKQGDLLVAMACLRLNLPGYREISTVATLPGHTGRGYATALVGELARRSRNAGKQAFLTASTNNTRAYSIYQRLGFFPRVNLCSTTFRWEGT